MYTYTVVRRPFVFEGNELMRIKTSVPSRAIAPEIEDFYYNVSKNFIKWCEEEKFPLLCTEYNESSQRKYIYRKKQYFLTCEITYLSETLVSVLVSATLSDSGYGKTTLFREYQCWDAKSRSLLPPKYALAKIKRELKEIKMPTVSKNILWIGTDGTEVFLR